MNIGIILFSQSGHTRSVCQRLQADLESAGHRVSLEEIGVQGGFDPRNLDPTALVLDPAPRPGTHDVLICGSFVQAFGLNPVMKAWLATLPPLAGRPVLALLTMAFPFRWMGGKTAMGYLERALGSKGGSLKASGIIPWSRKDRESRIRALVQEFAGAIAALG